ncbi:hypothetical protein ACFVDQ_44755 [Streptomyces sp. NPDC057684]|uniref:hypothetical protein n=1 Tax=unclassified Streptomyces TaxID=2593676 RepID=UPI0036B63B88
MALPDRTAEGAEGRTSTGEAAVWTGGSGTSLRIRSIVCSPVSGQHGVLSGIDIEDVAAAEVAVTTVALIGS